MRVFLHTFGCKANQYDTEVVRQALTDAGVAVVEDPRAADAAIVNSCTVTHAAERKLRALVRRLARVRPRIRTVVMGCAAARDDGSIVSLPGVSGVVGGPDAERVLAALGVAAQVPTVLRRFARSGRAWLKVQDGCDEHCTFCATTAARGANRSRAPQEVLSEAGALAAVHDEIVLTGVHIGSYGMDLDPSTNLGRLCALLVERVPRVRFRLSSVEATEVDDGLADLMVQAPERLAPHLHAPLQSGSDRVLRRMGRHWYTAAAYCDRIERLAARLPVFGLGADVMVGFPGETDRDFAATREVVERLPFTYLHVFPYSPRPGMAAGRLGPPVGAARAAARSAELREMVATKRAAHEAGSVGRPADVVCLKTRGTEAEGVTGDYLEVRVRSRHLVPRRFNGVLGMDQSGRLVARPVGRETRPEVLTA